MFLKRQPESLLSEESEESPDNFARYGRRMQRVHTLPEMSSCPTLLSSLSAHSCKAAGHPDDDVDISSPASSPSKRIDVAKVPGIAELARLYDGLPRSSEGDTSFATVQEAVKELNRRYQVGFHAGDAEQLHTMLTESGKEPLSRQSFAVGTRDLLLAFRGTHHQLTLAQLRVVMATAFERFDLDGDGILSVDEFAAALHSFNIKLGAAESKALLRFLAPSTGHSLHLERKDLAAAERAQNLQDQLDTAIAGAKDKVEASFDWSNAVEVTSCLLQAAQEPGSPSTRAKRVLTAACGDKNASRVADAAELASTVAGAAMVLLAHTHVSHVADMNTAVQWIEQVSAAADVFGGAVNDLFQSGPMGPVLISGVLGAAKALGSQELVALDENEALLYAKSFHRKGCSTSCFHKLMACGGCRWGEVAAGESLLACEGREELRILVRGKAIIREHGHAVQVLPPTIIRKGSAEEVTAAEASTYVAWDAAKLRELLVNVKDKELVSLVQSMLEEAGCQEQSVVCELSPAQSAAEQPSTDSWLSPVCEALKLQAKRKGLASCTHFHEGLHCILQKEHTSVREKMDQCRALFVNCVDELVDGLEAVVDMAGACSALMALWTKAEMTPDSMLQMAPILVLITLAAGEALRPHSPAVQSP